MRQRSREIKEEAKLLILPSTWGKKTEIIDSGAFSKFLSYCVQKDTRM